MVCASSATTVSSWELEVDGCIQYAVDDGRKRVSRRMPGSGDVGN